MIFSRFVLSFATPEDVKKLEHYFNHVVKGRKVHSDVYAMVVPGSAKVKRQAEEEGLDRVFTSAGFEWREAGCSMCLAMNPDKLTGRQVCASSSNRNFKGRQGSPSGRTQARYCLLRMTTVPTPARSLSCIASSNRP